MATLNDLMKTALDAQGFIGSQPDQMIQWAKANGAVSDQHNQAIVEALQNNGATSGQYNAAWMEALGNLGYTGTYPEVLRDFWIGGGDFMSGATFDGTNDYLSYGSDYTGLVDGKLGIVATRIRFNGGDGVAQILAQNASSGYSLSRSGSNKMSILCENAASTLILIGTSAVDIVAGNYYDILMCWDMAGVFQCYVEDANSTISVIHTDDTIDYADSSNTVGAGTAGGSKINADINFLYINMADHLDFSIEAERRKFFTASGDVADMGADGSAPTGTAPTVFLRGNYTTFENNKSGNGGLTVTGALSKPTS